MNNYKKDDIKPTANEGELKPGQTSFQAVVMPGTINGLIEEIIKCSGYSELRIAEKVGVTQKTIKRLRHTRMAPKAGKIAMRLIALYCNLVSRL